MTLISDGGRGDGGEVPGTGDDIGGGATNQNLLVSSRRSSVGYDDFRERVKQKTSLFNGIFSHMIEKDGSSSAVEAERMRMGLNDIAADSTCSPSDIIFFVVVNIFHI